MPDFRRILCNVLSLLGQWIIGTTFLFSGFVKAADPLGMEHKLEAYCRAIGVDISLLGVNLVAGSAALDILVVLIALGEFLIGLYYVLGMHQRVVCHVGTYCMAFMTAVTVWVYWKNPVPDCGCFGDALTLTNGQTLLKNIVLLAIAVALAFGRKYMVRCISQSSEWVATTASFLYILGLSVYTLRHLPLIDFTGYGVGTDLRSALYGEYRTRYVYRRDGEERQFWDGDAMPDSTWTFVTATSEELVPPTIGDFSMTDASGYEVGEDILADSGYTFLLTLPDLYLADAGCSDQINDVCDFATDNGVAMCCATAMPESDRRQWSDRTGAAYPFVSASGETLKAMVRSNPGLMLIHDGRIVAKWGHHDMPDAEQLSMQALEAETRNAASWSLDRMYVLLTGIYIGLILLVILIDRLWAGNRYYQRLKRVRLYKGRASLQS